MTAIEAERFGALITQTRERRGTSQRSLAHALGVPRSWLNELEHGKYFEPDRARLTRLIEALDIAPEQIDRVTRNGLADSLPGVRTYFRTKYALTSREAAKIEAYVQRLRGQAP